MYVCSCFGITEEQVHRHAAAGARTPRQMASASGAGTDCGSCVRRIQGLLGRGACPRRGTVPADALGAAAPVSEQAAAAACWHRTGPERTGGPGVPELSPAV